jgi:hypothetical protein
MPLSNPPMTCTECGNTDQLMICADIWVMISAEGLDRSHDDLPSKGPDFGQYSGCRCPKCGNSGVVDDFLT